MTVKEIIVEYFRPMRYWWFWAIDLALSTLATFLKYYGYF